MTFTAPFTSEIEEVSQREGLAHCAALNPSMGKTPCWAGATHFRTPSAPKGMRGFYKRGCQEKTLLPPQERNQISDIPLRPSDCNTICCVPRNFSLHVAGRSGRHSGTCKQRGGY